MYKEENSDGAFILLNLLRTYYLILTSFSIVRAMKITKKKKCKTKENIHIRLFLLPIYFHRLPLSLSVCFRKLEAREEEERNTLSISRKAMFAINPSCIKRLKTQSKKKKNWFDFSLCNKFCLFYIVSNVFL
jgi:hypothetical protein